jgi:hypothetical protein
MPRPMLPTVGEESKVEQTLYSSTDRSRGASAARPDRTASSRAAPASDRAGPAMPTTSAASALARAGSRTSMASSPWACA